MRNGFNANVTEPQSIEIPAVYLTSWLQRHADFNILLKNFPEYSIIEQKSIMGEWSFMKIKKGIVLLEALAVMVLTFVLSYTDAFYTLDSLMKDKIYQSPRGINNKIKIIAVDDKTLQDIGPFGTWSRQKYADVINALGDEPAVIAMDIMVFGSMDEEGDEAFIRACAEHDNVVLGSYINYNSAYKISADGKAYIDTMNIESIEQPIAWENGGCTTGFVNCSPDEDGIVRSIVLTAQAPELYGDTVFKSLASQTYSKYCEKMGISENTPRLDIRNRMWINYAGKPYDYEHIPLSAVLDGSVDPKIFKDCVVMIGAYASGLQDQYAVPVSADLMHGVEIHANILQCLIDGKYPVPADRGLASIIGALAAACIYIIARLASIKVSTPVSIASAGLYIGVGVMLNNSGTIIPLIYSPMFMILGYLVNLGRGYISEALEKKKITDAFKKYVAPQVVEELAKKGGYQIKLGGENRHIAVLFVDIRGFTPMSESLEPEQVVDILNSYLNLTTNSIFNNDGTLDKFIGDATMAVFNAPFDLDDYIFRAVKTAWDIVQGGNEIEDKFLEKYGKSVSFGVGVNCGNAVVGNIGCDFRMDYTAIGDTVNTAARLEANAKRGQVLISEYVYEEVKDRVTVEPVGEIPLKGKSKGVFVYSLTGITGTVSQE